MIRRILLVVLSLGAITTWAAAVDVNPPVGFSATKMDRTRIVGQIKSIDEGGFTYTDPKKQTQTVKWDELDPANTLSVYEKVIGKGDAKTWIELGKRLMAMKNGKSPADRAFAKALRLDPKSKEEIDAIKSGKSATQEAATQPGAAGTTADGKMHDKGPQLEESKLPEWPKLTDTEQQEAVKSLKEFAQKANAIAPNMGLYETKYFLFYSDLQSHEADKWASLLDRMYDRLCETFDVSKSENIWRGKALVFVFSQRDAYNKFEKEVMKYDASNTGGVCHGRGNGDVQIAFFRQDNEMDFAHVLVHEAVHGFLHRYRSPKRIPSWANEGLAEFVGGQLVNREGMTQSDEARARSELQTRKSLGDFFGGKIEDWQYPVARTMTQFMIVNNRKGYGAFIKGIKDGLSWEESLQKNFGATPVQLATAYAKEMNIAGFSTEGIPTVAGGNSTTAPTGTTGTGTAGTGTATGTGSGTASGTGTSTTPPAGNRTPTPRQRGSSGRGGSSRSPSGSGAGY